MSAVWPDPAEMPAVWRMTDEEIAAHPVQRHRIAAVHACTLWRIAAAADGWAIRPTYSHERLDWAWTAERDGFKAMGIARPAGAHGQRIATADLTIWGPDGLQITPPPVYDWAAIVAGVTTCLGCGATGVPTERVGFAGRYCASCAPGERKVQERPGWCD